MSLNGNNWLLLLSKYEITVEYFQDSGDVESGNTFFL